jgi:predicted phosphodiesterase
MKAPHIYIWFLFFIILSGCASDQLADPSEIIEPSGTVVNVESNSTRFAVIGDYGTGDQHEEKVADLVKSFEPDFIITTGDNNYPEGREKTIIKNIGSYYCDYIFNWDAPVEQQCNGDEVQLNRFFPSLGNHDYDNSKGNVPYLNYFTLPGNEIYYDFIWGPVHFFVLDSNKDTDVQKIWLEEKLRSSEQPFKIVYFHHPPFSSGNHGSTKKMQWGFAGADLVLSGHDHIYERFTERNGSFPVYIVNGLGGQNKRNCNENSFDRDRFEHFCYDNQYGAMLIEATAIEMVVKFISIDNKMVDSLVLQPKAFLLN